MNIENALFLKYKEYITKNSKFKPNVYNDTPQTISIFPIVLFLENDNTDNILGKTTNKQEYVDSLQYKVEIYTKNMTLNKIKYPKKEITNELKYLTFKFFREMNFTRTSCNKGEYLETNVDRYIIIAECNINNWNRQIR